MTCSATTSPPRSDRLADDNLHGIRPDSVLGRGDTTTRNVLARFQMKCRPAPDDGAADGETAAKRRRCCSRWRTAQRSTDD